MRVLYIDSGTHYKIRASLQKYRDKFGLQLFTIQDINTLDNFNLNNFDMVYSPCVPFDTKKYIEKYPNIKILFGPQFSVFPEKKHMDMIGTYKNVIYKQPSEWSKNVWKKYDICNGINLQSLPFGVDTDIFKPVKTIQQRSECFVYFKRRMFEEINLVINLLVSKGFRPIVFDYVRGYDEKQYISCLESSKFGVWVGSHESQGFALQEALSFDVPILVWNVTSMRQEYGSSYSDIPATTIPYWDISCGETFTKREELNSSFDKFISCLETYQPRKYILENLSMEKCFELFKNIFNEKSLYFNATVELGGGLGNQLFQLFALLSYGLTNNLNICIPDIEPVKKDRPFYWNTLLQGLKPYLYKLDLSSFSRYSDPAFSYNPIPTSITPIKLNGYFQSYKYFQNNSEQIIKLLDIEKIKENYKSEYKFDNLISLHFRLGDYLQLQDYHFVLPKNYYVDALNEMIKDLDGNWEVLYFCEENDKETVNNIINDIFKEINKPLSFKKIDAKYTDWESIIIMSLCKHHIIANSSFSWWGAYFNTSINKKVYYPSVWFGPVYKNLDTKDMCPKKWNKILVK